MNRKHIIFWNIFFWFGFLILAWGIPEDSLSPFLKFVLLGLWGFIVSLFTMLLAGNSSRLALKLALEKKTEEFLKEKTLLETTIKAQTEDALAKATEIAEANETEIIEEESKESLFHTELWTGLLQKILKNRPFAETVENFQKFFEESFPTSSGILYMYNGNGSEMDIIFRYGETVLGNSIIRPEECASFNQGKLVEHDFTLQELSGGCTHLENQTHGKAFCVPVEGLDEHFGLISVYLPENSLKEAERLQFTLNVASGLLGLFVANQNMNMLFEKHNIRDISTGLFNARHMEESLVREISAARRHKQPIGIIMIYPDAYELFLEQYGKKIANQLLWEIGQRFPRYIREEDIPCRYKDDLFCIIMPGADIAITKERAEKIRKEIAELEIVFGNLILKTTLSIGVSVYPNFSQNAGELIDRSMLALQKAFENGKNQVVSSAGI